MQGQILTIEDMQKVSSSRKMLYMEEANNLDTEVC